MALCDGMVDLVEHLQSGIVNRLYKCLLEHLRQKTSYANFADHTACVMTMVYGSRNEPLEFCPENGVARDIRPRSDHMCQCLFLLTNIDNTIPFRHVDGREPLNNLGNPIICLQ
jgi:hypothetical protein